MALERFDEQITCPVCLDQYTEPKLLQCHHVYCKVCLERLLKRAADKTVLVCPTCRKETPVPQEGGVLGLGAAFHINELIELRDPLRSEVISMGSDMSSMMSRTSSMVSRMSRTSSMVSRTGSIASSTGTCGGSSLNPSMGQEVDKPMCPHHKGYELQLYCETCDELLCVKCTVREHNGHEYKLVEDVVGKHKLAMVRQMEEVNDTAGKIRKTLMTVDARNEEVGNLCTSIEGDIHTVFGDLHKVLHAREAELVQQLDKIVATKLKSLAAERDFKETVLLQASRCARQVEEALDTKSDTEILLQRKTLMQGLEDTMSLFQVDPDLLEVRMEADMVLSVPPDLTPQCKSFGHILTPESIDPQKCVAKGRGVEAAVVDKKAVIFMKVQDLKGNPFLESIPDMECRVISARTGRATKCEVQNETENVKDRTENVYEISYVPVVRGAHEVHIKIDNMHVRGSPFPMVVRPPVEKLRKLSMVMGVGNTDMDDRTIQPWGIVVNRKDQIIISECDGHKVAVFSRDGTKMRSIGTEGRMKLKWPRGIALDGKGNIFVAEMGNHRVQKFNEQGKLLASGGTVGKGPEQFQDPKGLAFNSVNNKVYVADVHRVQVMNSDLTFHSSFGRQGSGEGQFSNAFSIACDNQGYVFVSDKNNRNIQVFTADGQFLKTFLGRGKWGLWGGGAPVGLAVDASGFVYVSDNNTHRVSMFSPEGVCVTTIGREGYALGEFKSPRGITVTEVGVIYVCDFGNNRVQVF